MKTSVVYKVSVEGLHCWPDAKIVFPEVSYLSDLHRHTFVIRCKVEVTHSDRDKEFIMESHRVSKYLTNKYWDTDKRCLNFEYRSCEMLAEEILTEFELDECSVFEDDENGAIVKK